jgi:hypothetical protein
MKSSLWSKVALPGDSHTCSRRAPVTSFLERVVLPTLTREHGVPRTRTVPTKILRPRDLLAAMARERIVFVLLVAVLMENGLVGNSYSVESV